MVENGLFNDLHIKIDKDFSKKEGKISLNEGFCII